MLISLFLLQAMSPLDVGGVWWTRGGKAQVEITVEGDRLEGVVIWTEAGAERAEGGVVPPDAAAETAILGGTILEEHTPSDDGWVDGTVRDLRGGRAYRSNVRRLDEDTLEVEGCLGVFCRAQKWERVEPDAVQRLDIGSKADLRGNR